jgi:hypothetical protein
MTCWAAAACCVLRAECRMLNALVLRGNDLVYVRGLDSRAVVELQLQPAASTIGYRIADNWCYCLSHTAVYIQDHIWRMAASREPRPLVFLLFLVVNSGEWPQPQGARGLQNKKKKTRTKKTIQAKNNRPTFLYFLFFLGAPCVGCGPSVDIPPHVGTRSWLWGLPLRASSL